MKAIRIHEHGDADVMRLEDIETPAPGPGQALVEIAAAGVNFIDIQFRTGGYRPAALPFTPGMEAAGIVAAIGDGVMDVAVGDRVAYAMIPGSYAESAVVAADRLVKVPDGIELETAAAVMLQGMTAHYLTHSTYPLKSGDTVLLHAAAGGAGALIAQFANRLGARVIGTVGSENKIEVAREAGVSDVIIYTQQDFEAEVKRLTDGRGVDVVIDSVGKDTFDKSLNCLRPRGYLVLFGFSSGAVPPFDPAVLGAKGSLFLTRPGLNQYIRTREELVERASAVFAAIEAGALRLRMESTMPLADAAAAHTAIESRKTMGKILLRP